MAIRVSGLISGLDTDSIVQELVSAYSTKKDKYVKAQTKLEWKMDAWKSMESNDDQSRCCGKGRDCQIGRASCRERV